MISLIAVILVYVQLHWALMVVALSWPILVCTSVHSLRWNLFQVWKAKECLNLFPGSRNVRAEADIIDALTVKLASRPRCEHFTCAI